VQKVVPYDLTFSHNTSVTDDDDDDGRTDDTSHSFSALKNYVNE